MFDLGTQELIVIFVVAFLVFGPKRLPELGRTLGKGIRELKSAMRGVKESLDEAETGVTDELKKASDDLEESVMGSIGSHIIKPDEEEPEEEKKEAEEIRPASAIEKKEETEGSEEKDESGDKEETGKDG